MGKQSQNQQSGDPAWRASLDDWQGEEAGREIEGPMAIVILKGLVTSTAAGGFKLVGLALGVAVHFQLFGIAMGAYGASLSVYSHSLSRGRDVVFPKRSVGFGGRISPQKPGQVPPQRNDGSFQSRARLAWDDTAKLGVTATNAIVQSSIGESRERE